LSPRLRFAPSCDIGLICDECCCIAHTAVYGVHNKPSFGIGDFGSVNRAHIPFCIDHAEYEEAPDSRKHNDRFKPEESSELVRSKGTEWEVYEPKEEEG
jgi:hypothetical protein